MRSATVPGPSAPGSVPGAAGTAISALDAIGVRHGTHLSSRDRDCLGAWQSFLADWRDEPFDLLEIGAGCGASLRTWREWFPHARLVGFDARKVILDPPIAGCEIAYGSQCDLTAFHDLLRRYQFRLIVDDGSRHPGDQVATFLMLFPWMADGGIYISATLDDEPGERSGQAAANGGPAWFAALGAALTSTAIRERMIADAPALAAMLHLVSGVVLLRGSAIVKR